MKQDFHHDALVDGGLQLQEASVARELTDAGTQLTPIL
jgi:hypothetical protein